MTDPFTLEPLQIMVRDLVIGPSTVFEYDEDGPSGLGAPKARPQDSKRAGADGLFLGRVELAERVIFAPVTWHGSDRAEVFELLDVLLDVWTPSSETVSLWWNVPGWGLISVEGQTRGCDDDLGMLRAGEGAAELTFVAGSPEITRHTPPGS